MSNDGVAVMPVPGEFVETVYGRQRITAVIEMPLLEPTVYLRAEDGAAEWSVPLSQFAQLLKAAGQAG